jgi:hypothetical protein
MRADRHPSAMEVVERSMALDSPCASTEARAGRGPAFVEGFVFIGHLTNAGQEAERYYAIGQGCALMLDPKVLPTCVAGADALLNQQVEVSLVKAR